MGLVLSELRGSERSAERQRLKRASGAEVAGGVLCLGLVMACVVCYTCLFLYVFVVF